MEIFKYKEFSEMENPNPGTRYRQDILTNKQKAENLGGMFGVLPPGGQVSYHFHNRRESIIIAISGEATEIVEGKEIPIKAKDVLYIRAREKHMTMNKTSNEFRYLEFFTYPPAEADRVEVK
ncbi:MAG: cupin domain-containing protein [Chloroflexi bacterium]|nr:cupin domain-containing protein [Chloroflexota bacterium]